MAKKMKGIKVICLLLLLALVAIAAPVSAVTLTVTLNKTYQFQGADLSTVNVIDLGNPAQSQVGILTTAGAGSDVQMIQAPQITSLERNFTQMSGSSNGNILTIIGNQDSTIPFQSTNYPIYIQPEIPTIGVTVPGQSGNPVVLKYTPGSASGNGLDSLLSSVDARFLYKNGGILYENSSGYFAEPATGPNQWVFNTTNLPVVLNLNSVNLNGFTALSSQSQLLGTFYPEFKGSTGKYYAGALTFDNSSQTATIDALSQVVFLKGPTPIVWADSSGSRSLPITYVKGQGGNVTLSFGSSTPIGLANITYMFINSTTSYSLTQTIDTQLLAQSASDKWTSLASNSPVIELLFKSMQLDTDDAYTYNLSAAGQTTSPMLNTFSTIAITPGYGIASINRGQTITIPAAAFGSLNNGMYYVYLMGTDKDNNIVALSQGQVSVQSGSTTPLLPPTIGSISTVSGYQNTTVNFTVTGTNFPAQFGTGGVTVSLNKILNTSITATLTSVTSTTITGSFAIPYNANVAGPWDVVVATQNAGEAVKAGAFTVNVYPTPTITTVLPAAATQNSVIYFTVTGTNFQTGSAMTSANFTYGVGAGMFINANNITINSVTPTSINGTMAIGLYAPPGKWNLTVTTVNGGTSLVKAGALTVSQNNQPTITTVLPAAALLNSTIYFTVTGTNFQTGSGMTWANFTYLTTAGIFNNANITINSVTPTSINGTMFINTTAPAGKWNLTVTTINGGTSLVKAGALTVSPVPLPTITSVLPASAYLNSTIYFTVTGANFQTGSAMTSANFTYGVGAGMFINANNITINSVTPTSINGTMFINATDPAGKWNLTVTTINGGTSLVKTSAMTVAQFPAPTITSVTYPPGNIDTTVLFTITGTNFQAAGKTNVTIYNDITSTVLPVTVISTTPTTIIGSATVSSSAPAGAYNVNVTTTDGGTALKPGTFTVGYLAIPTITSLSTVSGYLNTTVNFTVTGTNFEQGAGKTSVNFTNPIASATLTPLFNVISPTQITGNVSIPSNAATGSYRLDITTLDGGVVNKPNAFTVNVYPTPTITTVVPGTAYLNSTTYFTVTGTNFQTGSNMTWATFTVGTFDNANNITINSVTATSINGTMFINTTAPAGKWNLTVTTINGGTSLVKTSAMTVAQFPAPTITSITPATGTKNSIVLFTIVGTNFEPAGTSVTINEDTSGTVLNATIISIKPTTIVGNVTIPVTVPASAYRLQVTTKDGGTVSKLQAFTVNYLPLPVMTTLTPNSGYLNTTVPFTLTGNYFLSSGTTVMLRTTGQTITAIAPSFVNTTTFQSSFTIPYNAPTGSYTLYVVTSGGGFNSKPNSFTVNPYPAPTIGTISPVSGYRNTTVAFTLPGTNFEPVGTNVTFLSQTTGAPGSVNVMIPAIFSITPTQIIGSVTIPYTATLNSWKINVTTVDGGTTSKASAFTVNVLPAPTIVSFVPSAGARGTSVFFTLTGTNFEANGGTNVTINSTTNSLPVTLNAVFPTFITGTVTIPSGVSPGTYTVYVATADSATVAKSTALMSFKVV